LWAQRRERGFDISSFFFYKICIPDGNFLYPKKFIGKKKNKENPKGKKKRARERVGIFAAGIGFVFPI
jgi:hypothetical protein